MNAVFVDVAMGGTTDGCGAGLLRGSRGCTCAFPRDSLTAVLAKLHFDGSARGLFAVWSAVIVVTVVSVVLVCHVFEVRNLVLLRLVVRAGLLFRFCPLDLLHLDPAVGVALVPVVTLAALVALSSLISLIALRTLVSWIPLVAPVAAVT